MANPLEYAPEGVESDEKLAMRLLENWQELFADDEVSLAEVVEAAIADSRLSSNSDDVAEHLHLLEGRGLLESVQREGVTRFRLTMDGIRAVESATRDEMEPAA